MTDFIYYVYAYIREDGTPYYIGKGKKYRVYTQQSHHIPVPKNRSRILFLETNLSNVGACALERRYIEWYGRKDIGTGILRNLTNGGEGADGYKLSAERCKEMSLARIGKKRKPHSEETKQKMRESALKLGPVSEERKEKLRKPKTLTEKRKKFIETPKSEETKQKISETLKNNWLNCNQEEKNKRVLNLVGLTEEEKSLRSLKGWATRNLNNKKNK